MKTIMVGISVGACLALGAVTAPFAVASTLSTGQLAIVNAASTKVSLTGPSTAKVGQRVKLRLAFTDKGAISSVATTWGDATGATLTTIFGSAGKKTAKLTHVYSQPGTYTVTVSVGVKAKATHRITVTGNATPSATPTPDPSSTTSDAGEARLTVKPGDYFMIPIPEAVITGPQGTYAAWGVTIEPSNSLAVRPDQFAVGAENPQNIASVNGQRGVIYQAGNTPGTITFHTAWTNPDTGEATKSVVVVTIR